LERTALAGHRAGLSVSAGAGRGRYRSLRSASSGLAGRSRTVGPRPCPSGLRSAGSSGVASEPPDDSPGRLVGAALGRVDQVVVGPDDVAEVEREAGVELGLGVSAAGGGAACGL